MGEPSSFIELRSGALRASACLLHAEVDLPAVTARLPRGGPMLWLDSARTHPVTGRWSMLGIDPWLTFTTTGSRVEKHTAAGSYVWQEHPLEALRALLAEYSGEAVNHPCGRAMGLMGFLSYEMNRWIETLPNPQAVGTTTPEMAWYGMSSVLLADHRERKTWLLAIHDPHKSPEHARRAANEALERLRALCVDETAAMFAPPERLQPVRPIPGMSQAAFERHVRSLKQAIAEGEIFQANFSQSFSTPWQGDTRRLYAALRAINPSPFACYLETEPLTVVSCSPERLVRVQDGKVDTRPIAGTRPRGATEQSDAVIELELLMNEKERAEHVMLVDLARNDLGRISEYGSVRVNELMGLEHYSHVMHIISDVVGRLRSGLDAVDVIRALFPGGTITGCPKVRCMELLRKEELLARGIYTGSLGYIGFDGTMDLNIAIRTMAVQRGRLSYHVGAGIVADSDPAREYFETLAKGEAMMRALEYYYSNGEGHVSLAQ